MKLFFKIFCLYSFVSCVFVFADTIQGQLSDFGDFSSRSVIMRTLNGEQRTTQEQKDVLSSKKLSPSVACLIQQIKKQDIENVRLLLEAKINPNEQYNLEYPLFVASKTNNMEMVELLYSYGAKPDKGFNSELYQSIKNKNETMAQFFIDKGSNINYMDAVNGNTPLYLAIKYNMIDTAVQLVEKGAKVNQKTFILMHKKKMNNLIEILN